MTYTTKRHTDEENRFRMILPISYQLEMDSEEYKEFMENVLNWLPFSIDESANQRSRKWSCFNGTYHYNLEGEMLDPLRFIPKTSKNEQYKQQIQEIQSMDNLERWFAQRIATGNRNNQMLKFALTLVDSGMSFMDVKATVFAFNYKLNNKLPDDEIDSTIMVTVAKRYSA